MKLWLLLAFWLALALSTWARSQSLEGASLEGASLEGISVPAGLLACTSGPYGAVGSPACLGPACIQSTVSNLTSVINSAVNGAVLCLQRGEVFSATTGLNLAASHPDQNRVTICASTGTTCTDSGAANPRITATSPTGFCVDLNGNDGYTFKNLDCYATGTLGAGQVTTAWTFDDGSQNITIEGGVIDSFWKAFHFSGQSNAVPLTGAQIGTCAAPIEIRNGPPGNPNQLRAAINDGSIRNSSISVYGHDLVGYPGPSGVQNHWIDFSNFGGGDYNSSAASANVTIECSHFLFTGGLMGELIKAAKGTNLIIRDNLFEVIGTNCPDPQIGFGSHNDTPIEGWDGAEIYRNRFITSTCAVINVTNGKNITVYDNVQSGVNADFQRGFVELLYNQGFGDLEISNVAVFNNTIYMTGNSSAVGFGYSVLFNEGNGSIQAGRVPGTGLLLYNNLVVNTDAVDAKVWSAPASGCAGFGTNGVNIHDNYVYTPSDGSPSLWSGCSAAARNSNQSPHAGAYAVNPLLVGAPTNLHLSAPGTPPCGFSTMADPATDYEQLAFPTVTPFDVGAFRCPL